MSKPIQPGSVQTRCIPAGAFLQSRALHPKGVAIGPVRAAAIGGTLFAMGMAVAGVLGVVRVMLNIF